MNQHIEVKKMDAILADDILKPFLVWRLFLFTLAPLKCRSSRSNYQLDNENHLAQWLSAEHSGGNLLY